MTQRVSSIYLSSQGAACLSQHPYPYIVPDARSHTWLQLAHSSFGICLLEAVICNKATGPTNIFLIACKLSG